MGRNIGGIIMNAQYKRIGTVDYAKVERLVIQFLAIGVGIGAFIMLITMSIIFKFIYDAQARDYRDQLLNMAVQLQNIDQDRIADLELKEEQYNAMVEQYEQKIITYTDQIEELNGQIDGLNSNIETLNLEIARLEDTNTVTLTKLKGYSYIFDKLPDNSDLTVDHLLYSWEMCREWNVNPQLMWAIYDIESEYDTKCDSSQSTARGLGQVLESTAEEYWESILHHGHGSYWHRMAYDPYVNIEITTCIIGRNLEKGTLEDALNAYGDQTDTYVSRVLSAAKRHGYTITNANARYTN